VTIFESISIAVKTLPEFEITPRNSSGLGQLPLSADSVMNASAVPLRGWSDHSTDPRGTDLAAVVHRGLSGYLIT